jgi:hypothetical protein
MNPASSVFVVNDDVLVREVDAVLEAAATDSPDGSVPVFLLARGHGPMAS